MWRQCADHDPEAPFEPENHRLQNGGGDEPLRNDRLGRPSHHGKQLVVRGDHGQVVR
jgi:hypothetical protein